MGGNRFEEPFCRIARANLATQHIIVPNSIASANMSRDAAGAQLPLNTIYILARCPWLGKCLDHPRLARRMPSINCRPIPRPPTRWPATAAHFAAASALCVRAPRLLAAAAQIRKHTRRDEPLLLLHSWLTARVMMRLQTWAAHSALTCLQLRSMGIPSPASRVRHVSSGELRFHGDFASQINRCLERGTQTWKEVL